MKRTILCLGVAALCAAAAAAAPAPPSEGPVSDALRVQTLLPNAVPPTVTAAVAAEGGVIELERPTTEMVEETRVRRVFEMAPMKKTEVVNVVGPDGKVEAQTREVTVNVTVSKDVPYAVTVARATGASAKVRVAAKACKFFTVTKEGKLDPVDPAKATAMLKTRTPVLTGAGADVDPRSLDQIRPGTLFIVVPAAPPGPDALPPPPAPQGKGTGG
jgi:hypothetical protein